jgi:hypothetical protein
MRKTHDENHTRIMPQKLKRRTGLRAVGLVNKTEVRRLHLQQLAGQRDIIADAHELVERPSGGRYAPPPMMLLLATPSRGRLSVWTDSCGV